MRNKTRLIKIIFFSLLFFSSSYSHAKTLRTIKVALLDTPYNEMPLDLSLLSRYEKAYLAGIETAAQVAKTDGVDIQYKPFFYGNGSLDILGQISKMQEWDADLIIGPSSSDQFTLLKNYIHNTMVISAYASGESLKTLPNNFHSIFLTDKEIMNLLAQYIRNKFPQKNIYIITQADCKQCVDVSKLFSTSYRTIAPENKITEKKIIMDNIDLIDSKQIMTNHEKDVIIIFNSTFYSFNLLVKHLAENYANQGLVFFSDQDNWGSQVNSNPNKKNDLSYESYRIGPLPPDNSLPDFKRFSTTYFKIYRTKPKDSVSYMNYIAIMSAVEAIKQYPAKASSKNIREKIYVSYLEALKKNPNWFRVSNYGIYRLTSQGEVLSTKLKPEFQD